MNSLEHCTVPARMAMLAEMLAFVERFCRERTIGDEPRLRLTLVVEELFTNTIAHGHGGDTGAPIRVGLALDGDDVTLLYEDSAPPYDPRQAAADPLAHAGDLDARPVGGLGVLLVGRLAGDVRYAYEDGRNRLWLRVSCRGGGPSR